MLDRIAWHEGQHIKIQKTWDAKLIKQLVGKSCSSGQTIIDKWATEVDRAQDAFNDKDRRWEYPTYTEPGGFHGTGSTPRN